MPAASACLLRLKSPNDTRLILTCALRPTAPLVTLATQPAPRSVPCAARPGRSRRRGQGDDPSGPTCLLLPTKHVPFREIPNSEPTEHVQHLRPVVHTVRDDMGNAAPIRFLGRGVIEMIDPSLIPPAALGDDSG